MAYHKARNVSQAKFSQKAWGGRLFIFIKGWSKGCGLKIIDSII